jgi:S-formylglutathione hydrolase FrmB
MCSYLPMCLCGEKQIKKSFFFIFLTSFFFITLCKAASVDTILIYSNAMHKEFKCVVIKPDSYKKKKNQFPVVYLLHGFAGDFSNWIKKVPKIKEYADQLQLLIVCPDGGYSSWYFDSPVDSSMRYETYIGIEVPAYIDSHYRTIKDRAARAITGLSMGGHGAFLLAFHHPGFFGACGSMSGEMDLYASRNKFEIIKRLGDTIQFADNWKKYSALGIVDNIPKENLAIIFDCGLSDGFYPGNKQLHEKLLTLKIPHDYIERPGQHDWNYWGNAVEYQLLFFRKYFDRPGKGN